SHSLFAAAVGAILLSWAAMKAAPTARATTRVAPAILFFLCIASHGILDAFTDGGLGVAFFAPLHNERYFFPFTPIAVAPISITGFFTRRGFGVFASELVW